MPSGFTVRSGATAMAAVDCLCALEPGAGCCRVQLASLLYAAVCGRSMVRWGAVAMAAGQRVRFGAAGAHGCRCHGGIQ